MSHHPQALVLDFGGVITRTLFETHERTEAALGLPDGSLTWRGPFDPASDPHWRSMQAGKISERDYWQIRAVEVGKLAGKNWTTMQEFVVAARGTDAAAVIRPEALETIETVKAAGHRVAILSNELDLFYGPDFREDLPFRHHLDIVVDATYTGILKPDPRAYRQCITALGLEASDCVFVDDQQRNITGAVVVGMRTVHFDVHKPAASFGHAVDLLTRPLEIA